MVYLGHLSNQVFIGMSTPGYEFIPFVDCGHLKSGYNVIFFCGAQVALLGGDVI